MYTNKQIAMEILNDENKFLNFTVAMKVIRADMAPQSMLKHRHLD